MIKADGRHESIKVKGTWDDLRSEFGVICIEMANITRQVAEEIGEEDAVRSFQAAFISAIAHDDTKLLNKAICVKKIKSEKEEGDPNCKARGAMERIKEILAEV